LQIGQRADAAVVAFSEEWCAGYGVGSPTQATRLDDRSIELINEILAGDVDAGIRSVV